MCEHRFECECEHAQLNATVAKVNPTIIPRAEYNLICLRPMISIHLQRCHEHGCSTVCMSPKNELERNQCKHKVDPRNDESNRHWLIKPDLPKERHRIIHEHIESTVLLKCLHAASNNFVDDGVDCDVGLVKNATNTEQV